MAVVRGRRVRPLPEHREVYDPRTQGLFTWDRSNTPTDLLADASPRTMRRRLVRRIVVTTLLVGLALAAGSAAVWLLRTPLVAPDEPSDARAAQQFARARTGALRRAWPALAALPHTRTVRTVQHDADEMLRAVREREIRDGRPARDSTAGAFDFGLYRDFVSSLSPTPDPLDVGTLALGSLPAVLRDTAAYRFVSRGDSVLENRPVTVVEARARRGAGDGRPVRRVTLYLDPANSETVGIDVSRIDLALWYREEAWMRAETRAVGDRLVPSRTDFRSRVAMPFVPAQPITTTAVYRLGSEPGAR